MKQDTTKKRSPGAPRKISDDQLKELALEVKYRLHGMKLTPSLLERETGIGRNTWSRRMKEIIDELNKPVLRRKENDEEIYLPSIELIYSHYKKDPSGLLNELIKLEAIMHKLYNDYHEIKMESKKYKKIEIEVAEKNDEIVKLKRQVGHYKQLYQNILVSSEFSHLRDELKIKNNLINFNEDFDKNSSLTHFIEFFPNGEENKESETSGIQEANMEKLRERFGSLKQR